MVLNSCFDMNQVLVQFHIVKNAGGTIEWIFEKNFSENFAMTSYRDPYPKILPPDVVIDYLTKNPNIKAFSSQNIRPPFPKNSKFEFLPLMCIREPVDRAFSVYSYFKRNRSKSPDSDKAKKSDLKEYIKWSLFESKNNIIKNSQSQFLKASSFGFFKKGSFAYDIIMSSLLVVVDRFDESMVMLENELQKKLGDVDFSYKKQHVSEERVGEKSEILEKEREKIGNDLLNELIRKNKKDLELYEFANKELDLRIINIENFEEKLKKFRERCEKITNENIESNKRDLFYSVERKELIEKK